MPYATNSSDPWDWMQRYDAERFGEDILDRKEQERWCRTVLLGGLPYMWTKAGVVRELMFDQMRLRPGDNVLVLGECIESCLFPNDIRQRIGTAGNIEIIDITEHARNAYFAGRRGAGGQLATWRFDYTSEFADHSFDAVAVLQGVQHTDDWRATGTELVRVLRPGRRIVLGEITFGPNMFAAIASDAHVDYVFRKIGARLGFDLSAIPYYSPAEIAASFAGLVSNPTNFEWRGIEMFWGEKP